MRRPQDPVPARDPALRRALLRLAVIAVAIVASACAPRHQDHVATPIDGDVLARMAAEAEARLRALGQGTFEVQEFKPGPGKPVVFTDDFELRTRVYFLDYDARLHFSRDFTGPTRSDIVGRSTQPGWSIDQAERDLEMLHAVPPGAHAAGSEVESKAAAAFIDLEPGWRFDRLDGRRR